MALSQLNQVPNVFQILLEAEKITTENLRKVANVLADENLHNERQRLVDGGIVSVEDYEWALNEEAMLRINVARQDMAVILDAEPLLPMEGSLEPDFTKGVYAAIPEKHDLSTKPNIHDCTVAVANLLELAVLLANKNRTKIDANKLDDTLLSLICLHDGLTGSRAMRESTAKSLKKDVDKGFTKLAKECGIEKSKFDRHLNVVNSCYEHVLLHSAANALMGV